MGGPLLIHGIMCVACIVYVTVKCKQREVFFKPLSNTDTESGTNIGIDIGTGRACEVSKANGQSPKPQTDLMAEGAKRLIGIINTLSQTAGAMGTYKGQQDEPHFSVCSVTLLLVNFIPVKQKSWSVPTWL